MKLTNMKLDRTKVVEQSKPSSLVDAPLYPWGLSITLDEDALDALGIDLPKVGSTLQLTALVDVTSVSSNEQQDQEERRSVSLQITDMSLEKPAKGADPSDTLYGKKN